VKGLARTVQGACLCSVLASLLQAVPLLAAADDEVGMSMWFLSDEAAGGGWEGVRERSTDPALDPDLRSWKVRAQGARHYSRQGADGIEVCSVEIWAFESESAARNAEQGFAYPGWRFDRQGHLLVMLRGMRWARDGSSRNGLFPECLQLGDRTLARVAALLGAASLAPRDGNQHAGFGISAASPSSVSHLGASPCSFPSPDTLFIRDRSRSSFRFARTAAGKPAVM
jgi:hypothetical protein